MILREDILAELEKELGDLLATAPIGYAEHVLNALTTQELQSAGAYNRFL